MPSSPILTPSIGRHHQRVPVPNESQDLRFYAPIYMLNDDALLNIFYIRSLDIAKTYEGTGIPSWPKWNRARWWYKCAQVCQRWRYLILASPALLDLHLVCTYSTPVADMLAHSPPLPLIINFVDEAREASAEDQKAILLVLQLRHRVRRIGLSMPVKSLLEPLTAIDSQYPVLDHLFIWPPPEGNVGLILPTHFQAPHLRMLSLSYFIHPMKYISLASVAGLVSLEIMEPPHFAYFHLRDIVPSLSLMPQLESLSILFKSPPFTSDFERQRLHNTNGTHVALPFLRAFCFRGVSTYLEGLLSLVSAPLLKTIRISLFDDRLPFSFLHLSKFIDTIENHLVAWVVFRREKVILITYRRDGDRGTRFDVGIECTRFDLQVLTMMQVVNCLVPRLSVVERLALCYEEHDPPLKWYEANGQQWGELLRPFSGVKVLHVEGVLIGQVSRWLQPEDGEPAPQLLPELKKLIYYKEGDPSDAFSSFVESREIAGSPITLTQNPPSPSLLL